MSYQSVRHQRPKAPQWLWPLLAVGVVGIAVIANLTPDEPQTIASATTVPTTAATTAPTATPATETTPAPAAPAVDTEPPPLEPAGTGPLTPEEAFAWLTPWAPMIAIAGAVDPGGTAEAAKPVADSICEAAAQLDSMEQFAAGIAYVFYDLDEDTQQFMGGSPTSFGQVSRVFVWWRCPDDAARLGIVRPPVEG